MNAISAAIVVAFAGGIVFGVLLAVSHPIYGALRDSRAAKRRISDETTALLQRVAQRTELDLNDEPGVQLRGSVLAAYKAGFDAGSTKGWRHLVAIDGLTAHPPTALCAIANPHPTEACGEWKKEGAQ